jgi:drug/metabolite transporter (DMT)-like permease
MAEADAYSRGRKRLGLLDQPYLLLSLTSLFWAGNTIVGRVSAGHIPPLTLSCIRWGGAFLILLPFAALHLARDWPTIRKHAGTLALLAFSGFSSYNAITYYALQYTTAINGLLMQSSAPLFVAVWSFLLLGERLTLRQAGGNCVSLTGVLVIISQGSLAVLLGVGFNYGDPWFLVALLITATTWRPFATGRRCTQCRFSPSASDWERCFSCPAWCGRSPRERALCSTPAIWRASASSGCFRR